jgi:hypothetical protein
MWGVSNAIVLGNGDNATNNFKVKHAFTGNIVGFPKVDEHKIEVCEGTNVSIAITDDSGIPTVSPTSTGIDCTPIGCQISNIQSRQRYRALSHDTKDKDNMFVIPISDEDLKDL